MQPDPAILPCAYDTRLIVDSCGDFTPEVLEKLDVDMLGFPYILDGVEYLDDIWESQTPKEFYDKIRGGAHASTSAISLGRYLEIFERCAAEGTPTVYLCLTGGLSSSASVARMAAEQCMAAHPGFEVYVVESTPSATTELLAIEAVRERKAGLSAKQLAAWLEEAKNYMHGYFTLDGLEQLAAGGRIPPAAAQLSSKLDIKVTLSYDFSGTLTLVGMSRGRKKALRSLVKSFLENRDPKLNAPGVILTADAEKDGDWLEAAVRKEKGCEDMVILRGSVGPILGCHVGPGMVAFGFWGKDRRDNMSLSDRIASLAKKDE